MSWRYQTVFTDDDETGERCYSLIEVYFDNGMRLTNWTAATHMSPQGDTPEDLRSDINRMYIDAWRWKPVSFADLKPNMTFERAISQEECARIQSLFEFLAVPQQESA